MQEVKLGDVVARKIDIGEPSLMTYVVQKTDGTICTIVPFIDLKYERKSASYKGSRFATESKPEIFVHRGEIASVCCLNTELTGIFCRNDRSDFEEVKLESDIFADE